MAKAKKVQAGEYFPKLRQKIIKKALEAGITLEQLFTSDPPAPPPGQKHFPSIFSVGNGR